MGRQSEKLVPTLNKSKRVRPHVRSQELVNFNLEPGFVSVLVVLLLPIELPDNYEKSKSVKDYGRLDKSVKDHNRLDTKRINLTGIGLELSFFYPFCPPLSKK